MINATKLLRELRKIVAAYSYELIVDDPLWEKFKTKMNAICQNCT
jgi:hypothetical protein